MPILALSASCGLARGRKGEKERKRKKPKQGGDGPLPGFFLSGPPLTLGRAKLTEVCFRLLVRPRSLAKGGSSARVLCASPREICGTHAPSPSPVGVAVLSSARTPPTPLPELVVAEQSSARGVDGRGAQQALTLSTPQPPLFASPSRSTRTFADRAAHRTCLTVPLRTRLASRPPSSYCEQPSRHTSLVSGASPSMFASCENPLLAMGALPCR